MSLYTGKRLHSYHWQPLPIDDDVIARVHEFAVTEQQPPLFDGMPVFEWNVGFPIDNANDDDLSNASIEADVVAQPVEPLPQPFPPIMNDNAYITDEDVSYAADSDSASSDDDLLLEPDPVLPPIDDGVIGADFPALIDDSDSQDRFEAEERQLLEELETFGVNLATTPRAPEPPLSADAMIDDEIDSSSLSDSTNDDFVVPRPPPHNLDQSVSVGENQGAQDTLPSGRPKRAAVEKGINRLHMDPKGKSYTEYQHKQFLMKQQRQKKHVQLFMQKKKLLSHSNNVYMKKAVDVIFTQMSAKKGIKTFSERAIAAMIKEFEQLDKGAFPGKPVVGPADPNTLTSLEIKSALEAVNLIKEKRDGRIKGRTCANRSKQRKYLKEEDMIASPTVALESLLTSLVIDVFEGRDVGTFDVPGAYLHAEMPKDKRILMVLRGEFVDIMCSVNPNYKQHVKVINGKKVLYLHVLRAIYGCIESALLWYELFSSTLQGMGFKINPYDKCVANMMVNGKQCTIAWYVDDNKVSHMDPSVVTKVIEKVEEHFGKMTVTRGKKHCFLGMNIILRDDKKIKIEMKDQVMDAIESFGEDIDGIVTSPSARHLMTVDDQATKLNDSRKEIFHSVTAKLLYLEKRARPDIEPTVAFLCTRVDKCDEDDWKKLKRVLKWLKLTIDDNCVIGCDSLDSIFTWIDAAFAVHQNMHSQTGGAMSFGWGRYMQGQVNKN
jgi:hypothetical protein